MPMGDGGGTQASSGHELEVGSHGNVVCTFKPLCPRSSGRPGVADPRMVERAAENWETFENMRTLAYTKRFYHHHNRCFNPFSVGTSCCDNDAITRVICDAAVTTAVDRGGRVTS